MLSHFLLFLSIHEQFPAPSKGKRVVIGMSGGDFSVSAWLLKQQGYDVVGLFMKTGKTMTPMACSSRQDLLDAVSVADLLGLRLAVNFAEYKDRVFRVLT